MKQLTFIVFMLMACGLAHAQTSLLTDTDTSRNKLEECAAAAHSIKGKAPSSIICVLPIKKPEPTPPADMYIRHYFGVSYWQ